jgi:hypothetical protein
MNDSSANPLNCTQCGGELHPDEGQIFLTCPYCGATVYLDPAQVVFHWFLTPTLDPQQASGELFRWMSGSQTVKDLDKKAQVVGQSFEYFPLWYFLISQNNSETVTLVPAAATSITEITRLSLPAGDLKPHDSAIDAQSVLSTVPLEAAREWLNQTHGGAQIKQSSLVHIPIYIFKYTYKNQPFTAMVEAGTGTVLANIYPAKAEAPYLLAGGLTAGIYLILAIFFWLAGAGLTFILAAIAAPFLFLFAVMIASRV